MTCKSILTNLGMMYAVGIDEDDLIKIENVKEAGCLVRSTSAYMDPGGMLYLKSPIMTFQVHGVNFEVRADKAEGMLRLLDMTLDFGPYKAFPCHIGWMVVPPHMIDGIREGLKTISLSDEALHAQLDIEEVLANCPSIIRMVPQEINIENEKNCPECGGEMFSALELICNKCFEKRQGSS